MYKEWTFGNTKAFPDFYYNEPFEALDKIYGNRERTSFLLLNTHYFQPNRIGRLSVRQNVNYQNFAPQQNGCVFEAYANGVIPKDIFYGCLFAYAGSLRGEPAREFRNLRYLGAVDYPALMAMMADSRPETRAKLKQIIYRDIFYTHNIMARYTAETALKNQDLSLRAIKELGALFNEVANQKLDFTPVIQPELAAASILNSVCQRDKIGIEEAFTRALNITMQERNKKSTLDPINYRMMFKGFQNKIPYFGERVLDNNVFANFTPMAKYGNQIASLPEDRREFGVDYSSIHNLSLMSLTDEWDAPVMDVLFSPKIVFSNPEAHTLLNLNEQQACFIAYSQRAMGYRFLNTLKFFVEKKQIDEEVFKASQAIVYTHLLGNQANLMFNYKRFLNVLLDNSTQDVRSNLYNILMAERANLNWIYAEKCENLQKKLPEARNLVKKCYCSDYRPNEYLNGVANGIPEQFDYVYDRLYTDREAKSLSEPIQDGGKYDYFKRLIEQNIGEQTHNISTIRDASKF